jgi:hypothetical protein
MKPEGRFVFEYTARYTDGSGGPVRERSYYYEGVVSDFIGRLTQESTPAWYEDYKITDTKTGKEYKDIIKFIEAGFNEPDPDNKKFYNAGMVTLSNREIYIKAVKMAIKLAEPYKKDFADRFKYNYSML